MVGGRDVARWVEMEMEMGWNKAVTTAKLSYFPLLLQS